MEYLETHRLRKLVKLLEPLPATEREGGDDCSVYLVAIGKDETAKIVMHKDAVKALEKE